MHAKKVPNINFEKLKELVPTSSSSLKEWLKSESFLHDIGVYKEVRRCSAAECRKANYEKEWLDDLLRCGVIAEIDPSEVRGTVNMFVVLELAKERVRSIKHTIDINDALGKETLRSSLSLARLSSSKRCMRVNTSSSSTSPPTTTNSSWARM